MKEVAKRLAVSRGVLPDEEWKQACFDINKVKVMKTENMGSNTLICSVPGLDEVALEKMIRLAAGKNGAYVNVYSPACVG